MTHPWDDASDAVRLAEVRAALEAAGGNISHAAVAMKMSRRYLTGLIARYALREFAADLRRKTYGRKSDQGRPSRGQ